MYDYFREEFFERFVGPPGAIRKLWESVRPDDPRRALVADLPGLHERGIPIALYGDGVPCTTKGSLECTGWESVLTELTDSVRKIQLIGGWWSQTTVQDDPVLPNTKSAFWGPVIGSFKALETGRWPFLQDPVSTNSVDKLNEGRHLAGGYFCVPWLVKVTTSGK